MKLPSFHEAFDKVQESLFKIITPMFSQFEEEGLISNEILALNREDFKKVTSTAMAFTSNGHQCTEPKSVILSNGETWQFTRQIDGNILITR